MQISAFPRLLNHRTPHHAALLERGGNWIDTLLDYRAA
jgi:hypothetical protein